jgi:hypothetical protein
MALWGYSLFQGFNSPFQDLSFGIMGSNEGIRAPGLSKDTLSWAHLHVVRGGQQNSLAKDPKLRQRNRFHRYFK